MQVFVRVVKIVFLLILLEPSKLMINKTLDHISSSCSVLYRIFCRGGDTFSYRDIIACVSMPILGEFGGMPHRKILNFTTSETAAGDFLPLAH
jgi:hypothetical protein